MVVIPTQSLCVHLSHSSQASALQLTLHAYAHTVQGNFGLLGIVSFWPRMRRDKTSVSKIIHFETRLCIVRLIFYQTVSHFITFCVTNILD